MHAPDILGDTRGPLMDATRHLGVQRLTMEGVTQHGLLIGAFLGVGASRFRFVAHALIFAFPARGSMLVAEKSVSVHFLERLCNVISENGKTVNRGSYSA